MRPILIAVVAATSFSSSAMAGDGHSFGTLTDYLGEEISFNAGTGNSNTDFMYQNWGWNNDGNTERINIGMSTQAYYGGANEPVTNNGYDTFYVQAGADQTGSGLPGSGRWGFKWSITGDDGYRPNDIYMALRIEGPSGGSWGYLSTDFAAEVVGYPGSGGNYANQQVWTTAYDFMQVDSDTQVSTPGLWNGLDYDFNELGTYNVQMTVWGNDSAGYDELYTMSMNVVVEGSVVPGVGGISALGGLGLVGRRRRR
jgi:hypothetical protein